MSDALCDLASQECVPCRGGVPALKGYDLAIQYQRLESDWKVVDEHHLEKEYRFPDFVSALAFTNTVGAIAEQQNHHPDILTAWGKAKVTIYTHKVDGLTESDFVFAAKVEQAAQHALQ